MSSVEVLPLADYPNGTQTLGPIEIADDVTSVDFSIARCTTATPDLWPIVTTILEVVPEISTDSGSSWTEAGAFTSEGGIAHGKGGIEVPYSIGGGSLPTGTNRLYRVTLTISGGPLYSAATVEVN